MQDAGERDRDRAMGMSHVRSGTIAPSGTSDAINRTAASARNNCGFWRSWPRQGLDWQTRFSLFTTIRRPRSVTNQYVSIFSYAAA